MDIFTSAMQKTLIRVDDFHSGNLLAGTASGDYNIRDTSAHSFIIDLARYRSADPGGGAIDLGITLTSSLTASSASADLSVQIIEILDLSASGGSASSNGLTLWTSAPGGSNPGIYDVPNGGRFRWLPEVTPGLTQTSTTRTFAIPELRGPVDAIKVQVQARTTPDAGAIALRTIRRS